MKKFEEASIVTGGDDDDGGGNKDLAQYYLRGKVDIDKDKSLMTDQEKNLVTAAYTKIKLWRILGVAGFWNNETSIFNTNKRARQI